MKETIFDYTVAEIYEYLLKTCHNEVTNFNMELTSFALIFFMHFPMSIEVITKENIEKLLKDLVKLNYEERNNK